MEIIDASTLGKLELRLADQAQDMLQTSEKVLDKKFSYFDQLEMDYRSVFRSDSYTSIVGGANYSDPVSTITCDAIIPRVIEDILDFESPISVKSVSKAGCEYRDMINHLMLWDLETKGKKRREYYDSIHNATVYGTAFGEVFFKTEKEIVEIEEDREAILVNGEPLMDEMGNMVIPDDETVAMLMAQGAQYEHKKFTIKEKRWKEYFPWYVNYNPRHVFFNPDAVSMEDAWESGFVAVKFFRTADALKKMLRDMSPETLRYMKKKDIDSLKDSGTGGANDELLLAGDWEITGKSKSKKIPLYKIFMNYDVDGDGYDERIVVIYNKTTQKILGWEKFPYKHGQCPIVPVYLQPNPGKVYGKGICELLFDIKGRVDEIQNAMLNRHRLYENPVLLYRNTSGFDARNNSFTFGARWGLDSIGESDIRFMDVPKNEFNAERIVDSHYALAQKASGVTDYSMGVESAIASNRTATGIQTLIQEGSVIIRQKTRNVALGFKDIFNQQLALYKQYWGDADEEIRGWIEEIYDSPENPFDTPTTLAGLQHNFNIEMIVSKQDRRQQLTIAQFVHQIVSQDPFLKEFPEAIRNATIELLRWQGVKEPDKWYPTQEQLDEYMVRIQTEAQKMAMQQMQEEQQSQEEQFNQMMEQRQQEEVQRQQQEMEQSANMRSGILDELIQPTEGMMG